MDLKEVRIKINQIDEELKEQFNQRLECSAQVASVKMAAGDEVYKPLREKEIYARYSDDNLGRNHKSYMKKLICLSRKYQYSKFIDAGMVDEDYYNWLSDKSVLENGGVLKLTLLADETGENGLDVCSILEIVADSSLKLLSVNADDTSNQVSVSLKVDNTESNKQEALVTSYMLYKETIKG